MEFRLRCTHRHEHTFVHAYTPIPHAQLQKHAQAHAQANTRAHSLIHILSSGADPVRQIQVHQLTNEVRGCRRASGHSDAVHATSAGRKVPPGTIQPSAKKAHRRRYLKVCHAAGWPSRDARGEQDSASPHDRPRGSSTSCQGQNAWPRRAGNSVYGYVQRRQSLCQVSQWPSHVTSERREPYYAQLCVCVCVYTYAHACMNAFIPCIQKCMHATIIGFRMVNHHDVYIPGDQRPSHRSCFNEEIVTSQLPPPCRRTYLAANRHSDCSLQQQFHFRLLHEEGNEWPNIYMPKSILAYASVRKLNHVQGHSSLHTFISFCLRASSSISKRRHGWRSSARVVSGICTISDTCIGT